MGSEGHKNQNPNKPTRVNANFTHSTVMEDRFE